MCSTCNYKNYKEVCLKMDNITLQQDLGYDDLVIRCDPGGQKYRIAIKARDRSEFRIYRCPTCGHKLF